MALFKQESIERVREATDIVELVSAYTDLRRQGQRFVGLCPFHEERTPSFSVDPLKKVYYCFGCEAGGDVIGFLRAKEGLEFKEAVEQLADRSRIELEFEQDDPGAERRRQERERLYELLEKATGFFERYLWESEAAKQPREYLAARSLAEKTLKLYRVGFAPSAWDRLLNRARKQGYTDEELLDTGLCTTRRGGGIYDRFRGRIMFPLTDVRGRVVGFGARAVTDSDQPKYLNSPDGPIYRKGRYLFGLDIAKGAQAKRSQAIVVEGYTDVLALSQAGFDNAVAIMGTALTPHQIGELARLVSTVVLALDADRAGEEAMLRALQVAGDRSIELLVARLPKGRDPCELVQGEGRKAFEARLEEAMPLLQFQVDTMLERAELDTARGKDRVLTELASVFSRVGPSVEKEEQIRRAASRLDIPDYLVARLRVATPESGGAAPATPAAVSRMAEAERTFLAMCLAMPEAGIKYLERLTDDHLTSPKLNEARDHLTQNIEDPIGSVDPDEAELMGLISELAVRSSEIPASEHALEAEFLRLERNRIDRDLAGARERGDTTTDMERERERITHAIDEAVARST